MAIDTLTPNFASVSLKASTGYVALAPGSCAVVVTPAGKEEVAIRPAAISVVGAGIYIAIVSDEMGSGTPLGLILLDDFKLRLGHPTRQGRN